MKWDTVAMLGIGVVFGIDKDGGRLGLQIVIVFRYVIRMQIVWTNGRMIGEMLMGHSATLILGWNRRAEFCSDEKGLAPNVSS
jgi:hypothetical protein